MTSHKIDLVPDTRPVMENPYQTEFRNREVIAEHVHKQLDAGVIEPAISEWASPVVLPAKKDGALRFCVDFRRLNANTIADSYPLPKMDDFLDSLGNANIFTTLDANSEYWQIPIAVEDRDKTTFTTHVGAYRYIRMPFGLRNAPGYFQHTLDIILSGVRWKTCLVYLDDVLIFSQSEKEHVAHVDEVLHLLCQAEVSLKSKKCRRFQPKVDYLGHVVMPGKMAIASDGTKTIRGAVFPQGLTQIRSFLGACNIYRKFFEWFLKLKKPLNDMLEKGAEPDWQHPSEKQLQSFNSLKEALPTPPLLVLPKNGRSHMVDTDACNHSIGAVLLPQQDDEQPNEWVSIGYWSKTFTPAESNYSTTERE